MTTQLRQRSHLTPREGYIHVAGIGLFHNPFGLTMTMAPFLLRPGVPVATDKVDHCSGLTVNIFLDDEQRVTAVFVPCDNPFEWQSPLGIGFGIYTLKATAEDASGNVGSAERRIFSDCLLPPSR